jgi:hypothetical protein
MGGVCGCEAQPEDTAKRSSVSAQGMPEDTESKRDGGREGELYPVHVNGPRACTPGLLRACCGLA